jgi:hypothetical protein
MIDDLQTDIAWLVVDEYKELFKPVSNDEFLVACIYNTKSTVQHGNIGIKCSERILASWVNIHTEPTDIYEYSKELMQLLDDSRKYEYAKQIGSNFGMYSKGQNIANPDSIPIVKRLIDHVVEKITNHPDWKFRCPKN